MRALATLARLSAGLALVALVSIPLYANPHSAREFDPERAILLRWLAIPALFLLLVAFRRLRLPNAIELGALLYFCGAAASCLVSVAPALALAGDYTRQMGLLTDVALLGVFFAMRTVRADTDRADLLLRTLTLGGTAIAVLACVEAFVSGSGRAASIAGGPTYLGTHLALLLPLAVARIRGRADLLCALTIGAGLLASGSRAATVAAILGCVVVAVVRGGAVARRLALGAGITIAVIGVLALPPIASSLPAQSLPARVGQLFDRHGGDVEQRALLWRDALRALRAEPSALLLGRGPDSIGVAFSKDVSEELQRRLGGRLRVDRLHNDALDLLFTRGVLGLLGMAILLIAAIRAARRAGADDPLALPLLGLLVAATFDSLTSVPGVVSRAFVFAAAGLLAAPRPADTIPTIPLVRFATDRAMLTTAMILSLGVATNFDARILVAGLFLLLVRRSVSGAIVVAASVAAFVIVRSLFQWAGSNELPFQEATWLARTALLFPIAALLIALRMGFGAASSVPLDGKPGAPLLRRLATLLVCCVPLGVATIDDSNRIRADVFASVATEVQHSAGRPDSAVPLLDEAARLAPEIARYSMRAAIAQADGLEAVPRDAHDALETAFIRISERVHDCSLRAPRDGFLLAEGADVLLRVAERTPKHRAILVAHARRLARPALGFAPNALPVLLANARLDLQLGDAEAARALLERAITIDNSPGLTHLLLGRAHARRADAQRAAWYYSLALPSGVGRIEALTGIALAAASLGGIEEAARLVLEITSIHPLPADLRAAVEGARPLLRLVAWDRWNAVFEGVEVHYEGDPRILATVRAALDY